MRPLAAAHRLARVVGEALHQHAAGPRCATIRPRRVALRVPASARIDGTRLAAKCPVAGRSRTRLLRGRGPPPLRPQELREQLRRPRRPSPQGGGAPRSPTRSRFSPIRMSLSRARCCKNHRTEHRCGCSCHRPPNPKQIRPIWSDSYPGTCELITSTGPRHQSCGDPNRPVKHV